jgi:hypothetical protein
MLSNEDKIFLLDVKKKSKISRVNSNIMMLLISILLLIPSSIALYLIEYNNDSILLCISLLAMILLCLRNIFTSLKAINSIRNEIEVL